MKIKRLTLVLPLVLAAIAGPPAAAAESGAAPDRSTLRWAECPGGGGTAGMHCASLAVPVDWANPRGRKITLTVGRLTATGRAKGSALIAYGGPGGSYVDFLRGRPEPFAELRRDLNVVTWDLRGYRSIIGGEDLCRRSSVRLPRIPRNQAEFDELAAAGNAIGSECRERDPELFDNMDSASIARDMDAVRAALGETRLNLYASSYGGMFAQAYARQFPHRLRAMVLDGTLNHSTDEWATELDALAGDSERIMRRFFDWCARENSCVLNGRAADVYWQNVVAAAERSPISAGDTEFDGTDLQSMALFHARRGEAQWDRLARAIESAATGDASGFTTLAPFPSVAAPGFTECLDFPRPANQAELAATVERVRRASPNTGAAGATLVLNTLLCVGWPTAVVNNPAPLPKKLPPLLIAGAWGEYDAAMRAGDQVRGSGSVYFDGPGHTLYGGNSCAREHIDRYLVRLVRPPHGTTC